eukprot:10746355-Alexandrium_andersonii.AAC.1
MLCPQRGTPPSSQRRLWPICHRHRRRVAARPASSSRMMICVALATPLGVPAVCTCVLVSLAAASSTRMRAGSA